MSAGEDHRQAYDLMARGDLQGALQVTTRCIEGQDPSAGALAAHASVLKASGRIEEALPFDEMATARFAGSGVAWHNMAATLGDLDRADEAETAARKALALGLKAPETRLVLARALMAQGRLDAAEESFVAAVAQRPSFAEAHRELAQLIWMRSADVAAALRPLDRVLDHNPTDPRLAGVRATVLEFAGQAEAAREVLNRALKHNPNDFILLQSAFQLAAQAGEVATAFDLAERGAAAAAGSRQAEILMAEACLATGRVERAIELAAAAVARAPDDQYGLALLATGWRLAGDPRYRELYNYEDLVRAYELPTPRGWSSLDAFLDELAGELNGLHRFESHPLSQSLRHGSQAPIGLHGRNGPLVEAFLDATREVVNRHAAELGAGDGPTRSRNSGAAKFSGAWSVRLRSEGFHNDHIHPRGWLSSACYIRLPDETRDTQTRAGWIKFGQPGVITGENLPPEHFVQPKPGLIVLFPSYVWHGTVAFSSATPRLTIAFDALPA